MNLNRDMLELVVAKVAGPKVWILHRHGQVHAIMGQNREQVLYYLFRTNFYSFLSYLRLENGEAFERAFKRGEYTFEYLETVLRMWSWELVEPFVIEGTVPEITPPEENQK